LRLSGSAYELVAGELEVVPDLHVHWYALIHLCVRERERERKRERERERERE
jgi:hypothetical protein